MLIATLKRAKKLLSTGVDIFCSPALHELLIYQESVKGNKLSNKELLVLFSRIDDIDVLGLVKGNVDHEDYILSYMCQSLIKRQLFKVYLSPHKPSPSELTSIEMYVSEGRHLCGVWCFAQSSRLPNLPRHRIATTKCRFDIKWMIYRARPSLPGPLDKRLAPLWTHQMSYSD